LLKWVSCSLLSELHVQKSVAPLTRRLQSVDLRELSPLRFDYSTISETNTLVRRDFFEILFLKNHILHIWKSCNFEVGEQKLLHDAFSLNFVFQEPHRASTKKERPQCCICYPLNRILMSIVLLSVADEGNTVHRQL